MAQEARPEPQGPDRASCFPRSPPTIVGMAYNTDQARLIAQGKKRCGSCWEVLPLDQFYRAKGRANGYASACKGCESDRAKARNATETVKDRSRDLKFRQRYGISLEEYQERLEAQGGGCAICEAKPSKRWPLRVDHCHETGQIRGLLCHPCNVGIGFLRDSPATVRKALAYLEGSSNA